MTPTDKPCLEGCYGGTDHDEQRTYVVHAPGCPNAPCEKCGGRLMKTDFGTDIGLSCDEGCTEVRPNAPAPAACGCPSNAVRLKGMPAHSPDCPQVIRREICALYGVAMPTFTDGRPVESMTDPHGDASAPAAPRCSCGADEFNAKVPHALNCPKRPAPKRRRCECTPGECDCPSPLLMADEPRCPECGHQRHGEWCGNMASDNECDCSYAGIPSKLAPTPEPPKRSVEALKAEVEAMVKKAFADAREKEARREIMEPPWKPEAEKMAYEALNAAENKQLRAEAEDLKSAEKAKGGANG